MTSNDALANEAMRTLFNAIAKREGLTVVFDKHCAAPSARKDGVITLRPPSAVDATDYWYEAFHELGHKLKEMDWTYSDLMGKLVNFKDPASQACANILVDSLEERNFWGQFEGVDDMLDKGRAKWTKDMLDHSHKLKEADPMTSLLGTLQMVDAEHRQSFMGYRMEALPVSEALRGVHVPIQDSLLAINYVDRMETLLDSKEPEKALADLVHDILAIIKYEPPPPEGGGDGKGDGKPEEGDGEGEPGDCPTCDGTGEGKDGEPCEDCDGTGKCHSDSETGDGEYKIDKGSDEAGDGIGAGHAAGKDYDMSDQDLDVEALIKALDEKLLEKLGEEKRGKDHIPSAWERDGDVTKYVPWPKHDIHLLEDKLHPDRIRPGMEESITQVLGSSTVSKQIAKYLKALVSESYTYGQRRGKLHHKNMHRLITQQQQPGVQPAIYKKRNSTVVKLDSAVTLQLDCSGSMGGGKYVTGAACVAALSDTLTSLRIPHEILGFSEHRHLTTYIFKQFGTNLNKEKVIKSLSHRKVSLCENADGESVLWAAERLAKRPEKEKLQIVLSDGLPAGCFTGDGNAYLKYVTNMIETESNINLVGIGIMTKSVERFYKHNVVVNRPSELDTVLFGILKNFLL